MLFRNLNQLSRHPVVAVNWSLSHKSRYEISGGTMKSSAFWAATPCSLLKVYWCFGGMYCLHLQAWRVILIICILLCVIYRIYNVYNGEVYTIMFLKNKTNTNVSTLVLFCCWRYMFRPLYWAIIRRTMLLVLVLELRLISIWSILWSCEF
jgi:hypothetical protein